MIKIALKYYLYEFAIKNIFDHLVNNFAEYSSRLIAGNRYNYLKLEYHLDPTDYWNYESDEYFDLHVLYSFGTTAIIACHKKITTREIQLPTTSITHKDIMTHDTRETHTSSSDGKINDICVSAGENNMSGFNNMFGFENTGNLIIDTIPLDSAQIVILK
jgi:hypothetical protein